jgi:hypothetical protein
LIDLLLRAWRTQPCAGEQEVLSLVFWLCACLFNDSENVFGWSGQRPVLLFTKPLSACLYVSKSHPDISIAEKTRYCFYLLIDGMKAGESATLDATCTSIMHKKHKQTNISQACGEQVASKALSWMMGSRVER